MRHFIRPEGYGELTRNRDDTTIAKFILNLIHVYCVDMIDQPQRLWGYIAFSRQPLCDKKEGHAVSIHAPHALDPLPSLYLLAVWTIHTQLTTWRTAYE